VTHDPAESERSRLERNFSELLQELRVAQAGVQILFAFLLTLPFTARWATVDDFQETVYVVALVATVLAAATLIAPVVYHRILFRRGRKREIVHNAHRLSLIGLAFLFLAIASAVLLALDVVLGRIPAAIIATAVSAVFVILWGVLPILARRDKSLSIHL
jgi:MFS family permease